MGVPEAAPANTPAANVTSTRMSNLMVIYRNRRLYLVHVPAKVYWLPIETHLLSEIDVARPDATALCAELRGPRPGYINQWSYTNISI